MVGVGATLIITLLLSFGGFALTGDLKRRVGFPIRRPVFSRSPVTRGTSGKLIDPRGLWPLHEQRYTSNLPTNIYFGPGYYGGFPTDFRLFSLGFAETGEAMIQNFIPSGAQPPPFSYDNYMKWKTTPKDSKKYSKRFLPQPNTGRSPVYFKKSIKDNTPTKNETHASPTIYSKKAYKTTSKSPSTGYTKKFKP
jgi:hypothetical protein